MSHCLGSVCSTHGRVMTPDDTCPERDCEGGHGYALLPCDERCPDRTDPNPGIPCLCSRDADGDLIPNAECEIHWHQVIDGGDQPPAWVFP